MPASVSSGDEDEPPVFSSGAVSVDELASHGISQADINKLKVKGVDLHTVGVGLASSGHLRRATDLRLVCQSCHHEAASEDQGFLRDQGREAQRRREESLGTSILTSMSTTHC